MLKKSELYKMAVIGDKDSIMGFMAVGFAVRTADNEHEAVGHLHALAAENYAVIFITERLAEKAGAEILKYRDNPLPAVIVIPDKDGATGYGMKLIKRSVEHAVGADILFKN
ncbi:MAG: V-type ATP synthase subunit F [Eubacteriales bacterium]|jgi:V/A-type H+-transporting ATPase subunit F|nr:V-type ATP synthase subunit F [Eubacteriales bacterium]